MPKISRVLLFAFVLASPLLLLRAAPAASDPWVLAPGDHFSIVSGSYFSADSYHDQNGVRYPLLNGGLHEEKSLYAYNEFGWTKGRTFILGFPYQGVTRRAGSPAADGGRTETGFGDLDVGLRLKVLNGPTALSVQIDWNPPMGYNRNLEPRLGEGASSLSARLGLGAAIGTLGYATLEGGERVYLDRLAPTNQTIAGATLGFWIRHSLLVAGRYEGQIGGPSPDSIGSENGHPVVTRRLYRVLPGDAVPGTTTDRVTTHLAGPMLVYRIDDHLDVIAGSMHTASAKNALHVDRFYVAVAVKQTKLGRLRGLAGGTSP